MSFFPNGCQISERVKWYFLFQSHVFFFCFVFFKTKVNREKNPGEKKMKTKCKQIIDMKNYIIIFLNSEIYNVIELIIYFQC